jgi:hypothetical protein
VYNFLQSSKSKGTFDMAEQLKQPSMAEEGKISGARALAIAHEWIDTWNSGDLEQNLSLYADDCEMLSPFIVPIAQEPSGVLKGRATVGAYFRKLWDRGPNVRLELVTVCAGINSLALYYKGAGGRMVIEELSLRPDGKISRAHAHYPIAT